MEDQQIEGNKMKKIEDYTADELSAKIEAIKAERERTANALKRYEEELERRKNKNWLPLNEESDFTINQLTLSTACIEIKVREGFHNKDSFYKYLSALKATRKAWFANSKGEPFDIEVLKPLLRKGYVAMDKSGDWYWYEKMPRKTSAGWEFGDFHYRILSGFNIKPAENWEESLQECGL